MSTSYTQSESTTFTLTHAKHIGAKVATDLKRLQRFYTEPSDAMILVYEQEIVQYLKHGYLNEVTYGFKRDGKWIEPALRYKAVDLSGDGNDDDPGRIKVGANIEGASFYSYLTYSMAWYAASADEQANFKKVLPLQRNGAPEPLVDGYLSQDKIYSANGRALNRSSVRSI